MTKYQKSLLERMRRDNLVICLAYSSDRSYDITLQDIEGEDIYESIKPQTLQSMVKQGLLKASEHSEPSIDLEVVKYIATTQQQSMN